MVRLTVAKGENLGEELGLCPVGRKVDVTDATQVMTELVGESEQARARVDRLEADQRAAYEALAGARPGSAVVVSALPSRRCARRSLTSSTPRTRSTRRHARVFERIPVRQSFVSKRVKSRTSSPRTGVTWTSDSPQHHYSCGITGYERRGRDLNPRSAVKTDNGFRDRRIRPLCHLSERMEA